MIRAWTFALGVAATALLVGPAAAQDEPPLVDPSGVPVRGDQPSDYPQVPPPAQPAPPPVGLQPEAGGAQPPGKETAIGDELWIDAEGEPEEEPQRFEGPVPEVHVVRTGDTLWDICAYYFGDPWRWPRVWSWNPSITNPHWIYPGDVVRLWGEGAAPPVQPMRREEGPRMAIEEPEVRRGVELRQLAFVGAEELEVAGQVSGSPDDKVMLTEGDEVFLSYPAGKPPQVGKRYAIYTATEEVKHPETKAKVGAYVELRGEVQITEVKKEKKARGVVTYVTGVIERGQRVGPIRTQFKEIEPVAADRNLEGVIVAVIDVDELIGQGHVVFVDRGRKDGVKPGNRLQVVRRGDAYDPRHRLPRGGQDDRRYPEEVVGEILVVDTADQLSIGVMTTSLEEAFIGDHVVMRKGR